MITDKRLNELFIVDGDSLLRRVTVSNRRVGTKAGFIRHGKMNVRIDGRRYFLQDIIATMKGDQEYAKSNGQ